jgi:GTP cyclohydrolase-4
MGNKDNEDRITTNTDLNSCKPDHCIALPKIGTTHVNEQICVMAENQIYITSGEFELFVDIPSNYRAIHMSRNIEALHNILWTIEDGRTSLNQIVLEDICPRIVVELLRRHEYSQNAYASLLLDYYIPKTAPVHKDEQREMYRIKLGSHAERQSDKSKMRYLLEAEVMGISACPSAQRYIEQKEQAEMGYSANQRFLWGKTTHPTHMQRVRARVCIEDSDPIRISVKDYIILIEDQMSSATFGLLKRDDEGEIISKALHHPRFIEDIARDVLYALSKEKNINSTSIIDLKVESEESIHKHNASVEITSTIGEIIKECEIGNKTTNTVKKNTFSR